MTSSEDKTILDSSDDRPILRPFTLDSLVGQTLDDRYQIDELIGQGAMGAVFRARQVRLRRTVALKVPKPEFCLQPDFMRRFEREALTMAKIVHENIVQIFDVYIAPETNKPSFIAMEFIQGVELDKFLRGQQKDLTVGAVIDLMKQVAGGLNAAHQLDIVHRDIKPANIVITMPQRIAKVMDFGVAKADMEGAFQTAHGHQAIGTPAYMAPEQISGKEVTSAADVYSFGMMIYRLLSNGSPFEATNAAGLMYAHVNEKPAPITSRNPRLPATLTKVFDRALAKNPEDRPDSATALVSEIERALEPIRTRAYGEMLNSNVDDILAAAATNPPQAAPTPKSRKPIAIGIVAGACALLAVAVAVTRNGGSKTDPDPANNVIAQPVDPTPAPTPIPSPSPVPPTPTPAPTPTQVATPTPAPAPEPTPTPATTPEPTPTVVATPAPSPTPVDPAWNPATNPPQISEIRRTTLEREIAKSINERIEVPLFRKLFDAESNELARVGGTTATRIMERVRELQGGDNLDVTVALTQREGGTIWQEKAEVKLDFVVRGRPKSVVDPYFRKVLFANPSPLVARLEREKGGTWKLLGIEGDVAAK